MSIQKKITDYDLRLNLKLPGTPKTYSATPPIYSPVTELSFNLNDLSTSASDETPKRKTFLGNKGRGSQKNLPPKTLPRVLSNDDGCCINSPSPDQPPQGPPLFFQNRFTKSSVLDEAAKSEARCSLERASSAFKRFTSMPPPPSVHSSPVTSRSPCSTLLGLPLPADSPGKDGEGSQDSGLGLDSAPSNKTEDFEFAQPIAPAPRRIMRVLSDETNSPRHSPFSCGLPRPLSAPAQSPLFADAAGMLDFDDNSPLKLSLDDDDGFSELDQVPDIKMKGLDCLLNAPMFEDSPISFRNKSSVRRPLFGRPGRMDSLCNMENSPVLAKKCGLFRSPSAPRLFSDRSKSTIDHSKPLYPTPCSQKRPELDSESLPAKRRRSVVESPKPDTPTLQRCHSESEIKTALSRNDDVQNLVGDFSREYTLPLCKSKHPDMKSISPDTMSRLLRGEFDDSIEKFTVVDCRYPYEYKGGHIQGAKNIFTTEGINKEFIESTEHRVPPTCPNKRNIIIFHCEFSSQRGPKMSRFLREKDRESNKDCYPSLYYPEVYLLEGGYKAFYLLHKLLCEPVNYLPMDHQDHADDLKLFRAKSKSWAGERGTRMPCRGALKL